MQNVEFSLNDMHLACIATQMQMSINCFVFCKHKMLKTAHCAVAMAKYVAIVQGRQFNGILVSQV